MKNFDGRKTKRNLLALGFSREDEGSPEPAPPFACEAGGQVHVAAKAHRVEDPALEDGQPASHRMFNAAEGSGYHKREGATILGNLRHYFFDVLKLGPAQVRALVEPQHKRLYYCVTTEQFVKAVLQGWGKGNHVTEEQLEERRAQLTRSRPPARRPAARRTRLVRSDPHLHRRPQPHAARAADGEHAAALRDSVCI